MGWWVGKEVGIRLVATRPALFYVHCVPQEGGHLGPKNPKKPENPGYNNYGIFLQFYGDFRFK